MKYTILINQKTVIEAGLDLDLSDMAIFDYIKDFVHSERCSKIETPEGLFFWISHQKVISDMPMIGVKTRQGIIKRIDNLIREGVLVKHPDCQKYGKSLYRFGQNYDLLGS